MDWNGLLQNESSSKHQTSQNGVKTDPAKTETGTALYQDQEGRMRVIAFVSRGLNKS